MGYTVLHVHCTGVIDSVECVVYMLIIIIYDYTQACVPQLLQLSTYEFSPAETFRQY